MFKATSLICNKLIDVLLVGTKNNNTPISMQQHKIKKTNATATAIHRQVLFRLGGSEGGGAKGSISSGAGVDSTKSASIMTGSGEVEGAI